MKQNTMKDKMKSGLDGLIQVTSSTKEEMEISQPKKNEIVRCSFVMEKHYHQRMKMIAVMEGKSLQDTLKEALDLFFKTKE